MAPAALLHILLVAAAVAECSQGVDAAPQTCTDPEAPLAEIGDVLSLSQIRLNLNRRHARGCLNTDAPFLPLPPGIEDTCYNVMKEITTGQEEFNSGLLLINDIFALPEAVAIKSDSALDAWFQNVRALSQVDGELTAALRRLLCGNMFLHAVPAFVSTFRTFLPRMEPLYLHYMTSLLKRMRQLDQFTQQSSPEYKESFSQAADKILEEKQVAGQGVSLNAFLIAPLQRMVAYQLLFERLQKSIEKDECKTKEVPHDLIDIQGEIHQVNVNLDAASKSFDIVDKLEIAFPDADIMPGVSGDARHAIKKGDAVMRGKPLSLILCRDALYLWTRRGANWWTDGRLQTINVAQILQVKVDANEMTITMASGHEYDIQVDNEADAEDWRSKIEDAMVVRGMMG